MMKFKRKLFLDKSLLPWDCAEEMDRKYKRELKVYKESDWTIIRTFSDLVNEIMFKGLPDLLSVGLKLSEDDIKKVGNRNGIDAINWVIQHCRETDQCFPACYAHESMIAYLGTMKMQKLIDAEYERIGSLME